MNKRQFNNEFTKDDFLAGRMDEYLTIYNPVEAVGVDQYVVYNQRLLNYAQLHKLWKSDPDFPYILTLWQSNIGSNGRTVHVKTNESNSDRTKYLKDRIKQNIWDLLYVKNDYYELENKIIAYTAREGQCMLMLDENRQVKVYSAQNFKIYHNPVTQETRYSFLVGGAEVIKDLQHGVEIWHYKDPVWQDYVNCPSRLDTLYLWLLLENHGLVANNALAAHGWVGAVLISLLKEVYDGMERTITNEKTRENALERLVKSLQDKLGGSRKAGRATIIPNIDKVVELGKNQKDVQFLELLNKATEKKARAYSVTEADLGTGSATTYNNTRTFDWALYDKIGRANEQALDKMTNDWLIPSLLGKKLAPSVYIQYDEPENPDKINENKQALEEFKAGTITLNEYRESIGKEPVEGGDRFIYEIQSQQQLPPTNKQSKEPEQPKHLENKAGFFTKALEFADYKTPTEQALESEEYLGTRKKKGFVGRWEKAITSQIDNFVDLFKKSESVDLNYEVKLVPVESWYSFNTLEKDLEKFCRMGKTEYERRLSELNLRIKTEYSFDAEYPDAVLEYIADRAVALLKGDAEYAGVDAETADQIQTIIFDNITLSVADIAAKIKDKVPEMAANRARIIASTEVARAVETTQFLMFSEDELFAEGTKDFVTVKDSRVRESHKKNEEEGRIPIKKAFSNGNQHAGVDIQCRCTTRYYPAD